MAKIKRSLIKTFLNTTPSTTATWVLISPGVKAGKIEYGPKTTEETYIHEDTATISVDSYAPKMPIEATVTNAEAVFEYLDAFRKTRATLSSAETEVCNVYLYKGATADGLYLAEKQDVSVQIDKFGGEGGQPNKLSYTINYLGNPATGLFDPTALTFDETDTVAWLSSLVLGSGPLTLSPAFASKRIWFETDTTNATDSITGVAVDGDSVITIDVDGVSVTNGEDATWSEGLNHVLVTSTNGSDTALYTVLVTYTPGA